MNLVRMVYVSTSIGEVDSDTLQSILATAQTNDEAHDLTVLLLFDDKHFLQVIEGGRAAVSRLLGNLYKDTRHKDLVVLGFQVVHQRQFPDWSMQFVPAVDVNRNVLLRHGVTSKFEPYGLTSESAVAFMSEMLARQ